MKDTIKIGYPRPSAKRARLNVGSDVYEAADEALKEVLGRAAERARAAGRRTVK